MFKAYIAGALNSDAVGYIKNLNRMIVHSEIVRRMGVAVFVPGIDCMVGITMGDLEYNDYFDNSQPWLDTSDFVYVTPDWGNSKGTKEEIIRAYANFIPVFFDPEEVERFIKPHIICIIGESGSGKSIIADLLQLKDYYLIRSYTTRPRRHPNESGHTFLSPEEFDALNRDAMIAYTEFGGNRYCCLEKDVQIKNTYVIDDRGYEYLKKTYSDIYNIFAVRIKTDENVRAKFVDQERMERDKTMFFLPDSEYDMIIHNDYDARNLYQTTQDIVKKSITKFSTQ